MKCPLFLYLVLMSLGMRVGWADATPVIAFSNIPPPTNYKPGGSQIRSGLLKALLFTTPPSSETEVTSIKVGLTYCNNCPGRSGPAIYPSLADFQISLYSVSNQGGVPTPDAELYSIPMQYGLTLTGVGTEFTFDIPHWRLAENTTYAVVADSTDSYPVKWGNIQLGGTFTSPDYPAQAQNGFSFSASQAFYTDPVAPTIWVDAREPLNKSNLTDKSVPPSQSA